MTSPERSRSERSGTERSGTEPRAAQKALALLEAVARLGSGATARDISRLSGIPPATAYRLLNVLVADGYLVRIADLTGFALGRRTRELAGAVADEPPTEPFRAVAAVVEELRLEVRFGIFVVSYANDQVRLVDRDPDHELSGEKAIRSYLHASAVGKLLLAWRPQLVTAPLRPLTTSTIVEPGPLAAALKTIRETDAAREVDELRVGRSAVAVPVRDGASVVGSLVAVGRTGRIPVQDEGLADRLRAFAARVRPAPTAPRAPAPG